MGYLDTYKKHKSRQKQESYKLSRATFTPPEQATAKEEASGSFTEKLNELFALEIVGMNGIIFTEEERALFDERAGIYQYEAGLTMEEAENRAFRDLTACSMRIKQLNKNL